MILPLGDTGISSAIASSIILALLAVAAKVIAFSSVSGEATDTIQT